MLRNLSSQIINNTQSKMSTNTKNPQHVMLKCFLTIEESFWAIYTTLAKVDVSIKK